MIPFLRALLIFTLTSTIILYTSKVMDWDTVLEPILGWLFLFAFPMGVIIILPSLFLFGYDIYQRIKTKQNIFIAWLGFDIAIPLINWIIFDKLWALIGHF